jgi:hypothetical protein
MGERDVIGGGPAGKVDELAALRGVPPTDEIRFDAGLFQGRLGLEKLLLKAAMGQGKRQLMVEQDFHIPAEFERCAPFKVISPGESMGFRSQNRNKQFGC